MLSKRYTGRLSSLTIFKPKPQEKSVNLKRFFSSDEAPKALLQDQIAVAGTKRVASIRDMAYFDTETIRTIPPLPNTTSSRFLTILQMKLRMIEATDENDGKIVAIMEILNAFAMMTQTRMLSSEIRSAMLRAIRANIVRTIPPFDGVIVNDENVSTADPKWMTLYYVYQLLTRLQTFNPRLSVFSELFVMELVEVAGTSDVNERECISRFLDVHLLKNPKQQDSLMRRMAKCMMDFVDDAKASPYRIGVILRAILTVLRNSANLTQLQKWIFVSAILPLLRSQYLTVFPNVMADLFDLFSEEDQKLSTLIMKALLKYWPRTKLAKQSLFMMLITMQASKMATRDLGQLMPRIFRINAQCIESPCPTVTESALPIWTSLTLEPLIKSNAQWIFPIVAQALMNAGKMQWNEGQRETVAMIAKLMTSINPRLFRDCMSRCGMRDDVTEKFRNWTMIARMACTDNSELDFGEKHAEVLEAFQGVRADSTTAWQNGKGLQSRSASMLLAGRAIAIDLDRSVSSSLLA